MDKGSSRAMLRSVSGLFVFGCAYAWLVRKLGDRHAGYTFLLVVIGDAAVVLAMAPVIGWKRAAQVFAGFAAAGLPMAAGDIIKGVNLRERYQRMLQDTSLKLAARGAASVPEVRNDGSAETGQGGR